MQGLYRYVRNPMYLGVLLVLVGACVYFRLGALAIYAAVWSAGVHLFIVFYEEPALCKRFPEAYSVYCAATRRWLPRRPCRRTL